MRQLDRNLWVEERPQRFYGLEVGTRMTVIRLADGSLLLHSPVVLDAVLRAGLDAPGPVRFAVAPNRVHHLYAGRVAEAYPGARLWVGPGVERKRPDLCFEDVLGDEAPAPRERRPRGPAPRLRVVAVMRSSGGAAKLTAAC